MKIPALTRQQVEAIRDPKLRRQFTKEAAEVFGEVTYIGAGSDLVTHGRVRPKETE